MHEIGFIVTGRLGNGIELVEEKPNANCKMVMCFLEGAYRNSICNGIGLCRSTFGLSRSHSAAVPQIRNGLLPQ